MDKLLTINDISSILNLCKTNTYKLVKKKDFPKIVLSKKILVREHDLNDYITKYMKSRIEL